MTGTVKVLTTKLNDNDICSCYYCISHFPFSQITEWTRDDEPMAICPLCGIDSVVAGEVEIDTLEEMYERWFNTYAEVYDYKDSFFDEE